jgi:hypothetical protein
MLSGEFRLVTLEPLLGTPTYVTFVCHNSGPDPVSFSIGNGREDGFRFRSEPPAHELDPYYEFGGLAPIVNLQPLQSKVAEILLDQYLQFLQPGAYVVHCELDLEVLHPDTQTRSRNQFRSDLQFRLRDDARLRHKELAALETDLLHTGQRTMRSAVALSELRNPQVLPILERNLRSSDTAVVEKMLNGLGNIGGDRAKRILDDFINSPAPPLLVRIAKQELARIEGR